MTIHKVLVNKQPHEVEVLERNRNNFLVMVNEKTVSVNIKNSRQGKTTTIEINGRAFQTQVEMVQRNILQVKIAERLFQVQHIPRISQTPTAKLEQAVTIKRKPAISTKSDKNAVTAPIAGRIVLVRASVGQKVDKGECICVLEAMKMENEITAPKAGVIKEIRVSQGAIVNKGDALAFIV